MRRDVGHVTIRSKGLGATSMILVPISLSLFSRVLLLLSLALLLVRSPVPHLRVFSLTHILSLSLFISPSHNVIPNGIPRAGTKIQTQTAFASEEP